MFSMTTTVSSMMRPMATARPPSDIRLSVSPVRARNTKVIVRLNGMASEAMSVARTLFKNNSKMPTLKMPPMRIASRTLAMAVLTSVPWS